MQLIVKQMFNFTPPQYEYVVNRGGMIIRNAIGGVHLLCMPSFCMHITNN
jgi:hypothetical protein